MEKAIATVGGLQVMARVLSIKAPSIIGWKNRGQVPADRCIAIEVATNGKVTRYDLRPDVFGRDPAAQDEVA